MGNRSQDSDQCEKATQHVSDAQLDDIRDKEFNVQKLEDLPDGYPRLAALIDSDVNLRLFRRFGYLRNRLLLYRQDELCQLEEQLLELDKAHEVSNPFRLSARRYDESQADGHLRKDLMKSIDDKLREYDELLTRENDILSLSKVSQQNHKSMYNYICNNQPLYTQEQRFILHREDFITLGPEEDDWLNSLMQAIVYLFPAGLVRFLFSSKALQQKTDDPTVMALSNTRAKMVIRALAVAGSTLLLIMPVILLAFIEMSTKVRVSVILMFMLVFSAAISIVTHAKKHEIFLGAATYCAVLVVFLGNL